MTSGNRKDSELVTKGMLMEAVDTITGALDKIYSDLREMINNNQAENRTEFVHVHREISDLKHDTPSLKEFNELKDRVDDHLAAHV